METQLFQAQLHSIQFLALIFLMSFKSFVVASSYKQTCYLDEYITKGYFKKHDSLIEQEFDNYIASEFPLGSCKVVVDENRVSPSISSLFRLVIGEGSHRRLSSSLRLKLQHELKNELTSRLCKVVVVERLPSGVFADPFELQHLVHRGVFTYAAVFGDTNLELPSFKSNQTVVEIHKVLSGDFDDLEVSLEVPLHARYQPLGLDFSRVEFGAPDIFMCCSDERKTSCESVPRNHTLNKKASPVLWEIPCGNKEHAAAVSAVTFGFAITTALLIVSTSILTREDHRPFRMLSSSSSGEGVEQEHEEMCPKTRGREGIERSCKK